MRDTLGLPMSDSHHSPRGSGPYAQFVGALAPSGRIGSVRASLTRTLGQHGGGLVHDSPTALLYVLGSDAWGEGNLLCADEELRLVVGEPLFTPAVGQQKRVEMLEAIASQAPGALPRTLSDCHGSFAGVRIQGSRTELFTDKLGLRPIHVYYGANGVHLYGSSRTLLLQVVRAAGMPITADERGVAEWIAWNFCLGERTPWHEVRRLREATIVCLDAGGDAAAACYHTWRSQPETALDLQTAANMVFAAMQDAVRCRLKAMPALGRQLAFLSGGMDSRFVVASLRDQTSDSVVTMNIAPAGSLDAYLGNLAAVALGTAHRYVPAQDGLASAMDQATAACQTELGQTQPSLWWSGDGGSVGLGHVYLSADMCRIGVDALPAPELARLIMEFNRRGVSGKALAPAYRTLVGLPVRGVEDELRRLRHVEPRRLAFAFMLFNDQQRHLDAHYDRLHERAFDLVLPFFDARLLELVMRIPVGLMLQHRLYNAIFAAHPMGAVAWQAYPGHEPCPHPLPPGLRHQWSDGWHSRAQWARVRRRRACQALGGLLGAPPQLDRINVMAAALATWTGLRDLSYVLKEAHCVNVGFRP